MIKKYSELNRIYYHVTPSAKVQTIMREGLIPGMGQRSEKMENIPAIFLFRSEEDAYEALANWMGDEFEEDTPLTLLKVKVPSELQMRQEAFECQVFEKIFPENISVVKENI